MEHIDKKRSENILGKNTCFISKDKVLSTYGISSKQLSLLCQENSTNSSKELQWVPQDSQLLLMSMQGTLKNWYWVMNVPYLAHIGIGMSAMSLA